MMRSAIVHRLIGRLKHSLHVFIAYFIFCFVKCFYNKTYAIRFYDTTHQGSSYSSNLAEGMNVSPDIMASELFREFHLFIYLLDTNRKQQWCWEVLETVL